MASAILVNCLSPDSFSIAQRQEWGVVGSRSHEPVKFSEPLLACDVKVGVKL